MIHLRELNENDVTQILEWPAYADDMEQMDYALRKDGWLEEFRSRADTTIYAAMDRDELVGFSILSKTGAQEAEFRIALRADRTGKRLGEAISSLTLQKGFETMGFSRIHLIVRKNNKRAIQLYRRLGFVECGECTKKVREREVDFKIMEIGPDSFARYGRMKAIANAQRRALIVVDVQNDYAGGHLPIAYPPVEESLDNIARAMDGARRAGIPVVVVQNMAPEGAAFLASGTDGAELHEIVAARGWDHYVRKSLPSAFVGTDLEEWLRANNIETITVVGYMTHNCDFSTAVYGMHMGFRVELLSDATGSVPYKNRAGGATAEEIHRVMAVVMQSRFAAVMTTAEWIGMLDSGESPERDTIYGSFQRAMEDNLSIV